jgi:DNA-binding GntR family transcriptional regulator
MIKAERDEAAPIAWPRGRADLLYERFKECIVNQEWEPGAAINIDRLAARYHVSITPVREALARLTTDRLVVAIPNRGYRVAPLPSPERLAEIFALRSLLEPYAAAQAAQHIAADDLALLHAEHRAIATLKTNTAQDDIRAFAFHNRAFHQCIMRASGNGVLVELYDQLGFHAVTGHVYLTHGIFSLADVVAEHQAILDAFESRDPERAERAMRTHIDVGNRRALDAYTRLIVADHEMQQRP